MKKIVNTNNLEKILNKIRNKKTIGFTNGCFDILHAGHCHLLKQSKKFCDILIVAVNTDASIKRIKGKNRPFNVEKNRLAVLESISYIDYIVIFNSNTPIELIKIIKPDILFKGKDYIISQIVGNEFIKSYGGKIKRIQMIKNLSSSKLIKKTKK